MNNTKQALVIDISPWPNGYGFQGASDWWNYVLSQEESKRLDNLMGLALLDEDLRRRLVHERDTSLFNAFKLAPPTQAWLKSIKATTLTELAQEIVAGPQGNYLEEVS
jgi:hypothetical protein